MGMQPQDLAPDVITYSASISACEKGQQPQTTMSLLASMQPHDLAPDVITYSTAISACEKGQQPHTAMSLLTSMHTHDLAPSVITYRAATNSHAPVDINAYPRLGARRHHLQRKHQRLRE